MYVRRTLSISLGLNPAKIVKKTMQNKHAKIGRAVLDTAQQKVDAFNAHQAPSYRKSWVMGFEVTAACYRSLARLANFVPHMNHSIISPRSRPMTRIRKNDIRWLLPKLPFRSSLTSCFQTKSRCLKCHSHVFPTSAVVPWRNPPPRAVAVCQR